MKELKGAIIANMADSELLELITEITLQLSARAHLREKEGE